MLSMGSRLRGNDGGLFGAKEAWWTFCDTLLRGNDDRILQC